MELLSSNSMLMMQKSLDFLWSKQSCILDNMANVETPGYKVKYATFEESLEDAIRSASKNASPSASVRNAIENTQVQIHEAQESSRMDDNGVNVTEQMVEPVSYTHLDVYKRQGLGPSGRCPQPDNGMVEACFRCGMT